MNILITLSFILISVSCNNYKKNKTHSIPQELDKITIRGRFYNGNEFERKLKMVINNSELDSITKTYILDRIEFFKEKYDPANDEYGLMQNPSNFLFLDVNDDKIEDLIFQSNGPFITDNHAFFVFLSNNKKYKLVRELGQIIDMQIIEEFCCAFDSKKEKYLKVDYFKSGCCDNPWDQYVTGILSLNTRVFSDQFYIISLKAVNRTAQRELKSKRKQE